jgi:hypothetical protein
VALWLEPSLTLDLFTLYFFMARDRHTVRLPVDFFPHSFKAFASFCARVNRFGVTTGFNLGGVMLPSPENVALPDGPKIPGCNTGAALHESAVVHGGGTVELAVQGANAEHT